MNVKEMMKNPLFKGIEENEMNQLLKCLHAYTKQYKKGEMILRRGDHVDFIGYMLKGSAHIIKDDYWGNRTIIKEIKAHEIFAEAYACVAAQELEVSLLAKEECEIMFLKVSHVIGICHEACGFHQRIIANLLTIASQKNLLLTRKMEHITKRSTREKILSYLSSQSLEKGSRTITIPFDRQQLADYLSVDRSALSSELSKMAKDGIIKYHKNHFELL